jgi:hypothetical protein
VAAHAVAVTLDVHERNAKLLLTLVLGPFERVEGLYLHPDQRRRLVRSPVKDRLSDQ